MNRGKRRYLVACASMQDFGIGDVIAAFIGAIFGATATGWVSSWRERRHNKSELRGLLRLISSEMHYNDTLMEGFHDTPEGYAEAMLELRTDTWDKVAERLAQLLSSDRDLSLLVFYYGYIRLMQIDPSQTTREHIAELRSCTEVADGIAAKYRLPWDE